MVNSFDRLFFSPLGSKYCMYFYIMGIIGLIFAGIMSMILLSSIIYTLYTGKYKTMTMVNYTTYTNNLANILMLGLIYLSNRILYNMCLHSS